MASPGRKGKATQADVVGMLTVRAMDCGAIQIPVQFGDTVADLKVKASKQLKKTWWQLQWMAAGKTDILKNDFEDILKLTSEVTSVVAGAMSFPLDSGVFASLVATDNCGPPRFAEPEADGRLVLPGELHPPSDPILMASGETAALIAEQQKLTVVGDADVDYIAAGWSESVHLQPDSAPILLGWRVRYVTNGFFWSDPRGTISTGGPSFGLTTAANLTTNATTGPVPAVIRFAPTEATSAVFCSKSSVCGLQCVEECVGLQCASPILFGAISGGGLPTLCPNETSGYDYDVFIVLDSAKREVRASVGWGTPGARIDTLTVPAELWPSAELPLMPFVSLTDEDFAGMQYQLPEALPISFEALRREHVPEGVIQALCPTIEADLSTQEVATLSGFWVSEKGQCRICNDKITSKLAYEELIGDGTMRLHGWLESAAREVDGLSWQSELMILEEGDEYWYGPSCGEKPDVVGSIKVTLLDNGEGIATMIKTESHGDWHSRTTFKSAPDDDNENDEEHTQMWPFLFIDATNIPAGDSDDEDLSYPVSDDEEPCYQ